jgi:hypothetical protein
MRRDFPVIHLNILIDVEKLEDFSTITHNSIQDGVTQISQVWEKQFEKGTLFHLTFDKRRSLGRYSSLADSGHRVFYLATKRLCYL